VSAMGFAEPLELGADWAKPDGKTPDAVVMLLHGGRQTPEEMGAIALGLDCPNVRYILPRAPDGGWYPKSFLEPFEENQPQVNEAIAHVSGLLEAIRGKGVALDRILLGGFAEGACVLSEFLVRNPKSYGGLMILTGGLMDHTGIGKRPGSGLLAVPTYVSGSEIGQEVPVQRIRDTIRTLQAGGALIRSHIFTERPFILSDEEKVEMRKLILEAVAAAEPN
jgi:phospholipase/carboxylesterase